MPPIPEARVAAPYNTPQDPKQFNYGDPAAASRLTLVQVLAILGQVLPVLSGFLSSPQMQAAAAEMAQKKAE